MKYMALSFSFKLYRQGNKSKQGLSNIIAGVESGFQARTSGSSVRNTQFLRDFIVIRNYLIFHLILNTMNMDSNIPGKRDIEDRSRHNISEIDLLLFYSSEQDKNLV